MTIRECRTHTDGPTDGQNCYIHIVALMNKCASTCDENEKDVTYERHWDVSCDMQKLFFSKRSLIFCQPKTASTATYSSATNVASWYHEAYGVMEAGNQSERLIDLAALRPLCFPIWLMQRIYDEWTNESHLWHMCRCTLAHKRRCPVGVLLPRIWLTSWWSDRFDWPIARLPCTVH